MLHLCSTWVCLDVCILMLEALVQQLTLTLAIGAHAHSESQDWVFYTSQQSDSAHLPDFNHKRLGGVMDIV